MARISNAIIEDVRLAAGSVGPIPIRLTGTELALAGHAIDDRLLETAGKVMAEEIQPINDIRSTAEYRTAVLRNLLENSCKVCRVQGLLRELCPLALESFAGWRSGKGGTSVLWIAGLGKRYGFHPSGSRYGHPPGDFR